MIQLVYVSTSVKPFTNDDLFELLGKARKSNEALGITGMLLYKNSEFMQALEGDADSVHSVSAKIAKDPRHKEIQILVDDPCKQREFPDWSMGFQNLNDIDPRDVPGYNTFLKQMANTPEACGRVRTRHDAPMTEQSKLPMAESMMSRGTGTH